MTTSPAMTYITQDKKGSIWRKWDLHFHTPSSYDYQGGAVSNQQIIDELLRNQIEVVAITDHHIIDVPRIRELQRLGSGKITVLPGIEFLSDSRGSEPVHFIAIFSENSDMEYIWAQLENKTEIHRIKKDGKKCNEVYCDLFDTAKLVKENNGILTIHAGSKSNGIENITNALPHGIAQKEDIAKVIDIFEIGKGKDIEEYNSIVLPFLLKKINKKFPLIICSDNHDINKYNLKQNLWIKGDPNFLGLKQLLNQTDRVFIGDRPAGLDIVDNNLTKFIDRVAIRKREDSTLDELWFNTFEVNLNSGLVAIIGNKGNGKSALTDIIGLCGNTHNYKGFSFLHEDKFLRKKDKKADHFDAAITWKNGKINKLCLSETPDLNQEERVKYIPQSHLENLCVSIDSSDFEQELREIIFSHIPKGERLGKNSLDELINHKTEIIRDDIEKIKSKLSIVNNDILLLEEKQNPAFLLRIEKSLDLKLEEQESHLSSKPIFQHPPLASEDSTFVDVNNKISTLRTENETITSLLKKNESKVGELRKEIEVLVQRKQSLESLKARLDSQKAENKAILDTFQIDIESIFNFTVDTSLITNLINQKNSEVSVLVNSLSQTGPNVLRQVQIKNELSELQSKLDQPTKLYQQYLNSIEIWTKIDQDIIGDIDSEGSIENLKSVISYIKGGLAQDLKNKFLERKDLIKKIFTCKISILNIYKELYDSVMKFISNHSEIMDSYKITFDTLFKESGLFNKFETYINFNSKGTYQGVSTGLSKLKDTFDRYDFENEDNVYNFVFDILDQIKYDRRTAGNVVFMEIKNQLKSGNTPIDFYNYICGLDYLIPVYDLKLSNKNVASLSPGERGALLLIFYLVLDNNNIPLIIDQPEENLDNQSVYNILVPFISIAK